MKKNAPGCNCCGRCLIWDMGAFADFDAINSQPSEYTTFFDWELTADWINGIGKEEEEIPAWDSDESKVDFALGSPRPAGDFWGTFIGDEEGCLESLEPGAAFDPETDGVTLEYWTGDINDYSLIIWATPFTDDRTVFDYLDEIDPDGTDCNSPDLIDNCEDDFGKSYTDALWIRGGIPGWWNDVVSGTWRGRVVVCLGGGHPKQSIADPAAFMVNEHIDIGMDVDVSTRRGTPITAESNPAATAEEEPLLEDVSVVYSSAGFSNAIDGGTPLFTNEGSLVDFCEVGASSSPATVTSVARENLPNETNTANRVEFILCNVGHVMSDSSPAAEADETITNLNTGSDAETQNKQFVINLFRKPLHSLENQVES